MEENKLKLALAFVIGIIITLIGVNFLSNTFNPFVSKHLCPMTGRMMAGYGPGYGGGLFFGFLFNIILIGAIVLVIYYLMTKDKDESAKKKRR